MDPPNSFSRALRRSAPRARGDGPARVAATYLRQTCSPRPRGWTRARRCYLSAADLLPAPAGMDPSRARLGSFYATAPRARGDGPSKTSRRRCPTSCSPRPRGWTRRRADRLRLGHLLPAPAGMDPRSSPPQAVRPPAPHARGDGPDVFARIRLADGCSPRPRGWTPCGWLSTTARRLLPAPAGMDPPRAAPGPRSRPAPRARGDGPNCWAAGWDSADCSPRSWGMNPALGTAKMLGDCSGCRVSYRQRTRDTNLTARAQSEETGAAWSAIVRSGKSRSVPDAFGAQTGSARGTAQPDCSRCLTERHPHGALPMRQVPSCCCRGARADFRSSRFMRSGFRACSVAKGRGRNRRRRCLRPVGISDWSMTFNDGRFVPVFAGDGDSESNSGPVAEG